MAPPGGASINVYIINKKHAIYYLLVTCVTCLPLLIYNIYAKQLVVFAHQHQTSTERLKGEQLGPTKVEEDNYVCMSQGASLIRLVNLRFDPKKIATKQFLSELSFIGYIN